ncbi:unnamed protein product [Nyctereutes procyonoides]|uniref:(raccoon dog) hypothetical protein n=1 Tax=Nyctereutes procyonoides TaxID=34880 RepID=A0A811YR99_NYCPR|nr:unnamed protein product [Nyctereutes procyonoides]
MHPRTSELELPAQEAASRRRGHTRTQDHSSPSWSSALGGESRSPGGRARCFSAAADGSCRPPPRRPLPRALNPHSSSAAQPPPRAPATAAPTSAPPAAPAAALPLPEAAALPEVPPRPPRGRRGSPPPARRGGAGTFRRPRAWAAGAGRAGGRASPGQVKDHLSRLLPAGSVGSPGSEDLGVCVFFLKRRRGGLRPRRRPSDPRPDPRRAAPPSGLLRCPCSCSCSCRCFWVLFCFVVLFCGCTGNAVPGEGRLYSRVSVQDHWATRPPP